jgi:hypothetical protein
MLKVCFAGRMRIYGLIYYWDVIILALSAKKTCLCPPAPDSGLYPNFRLEARA